MFIKNSESIKRKTIEVDEIVRDYLIEHNYSPISFKDGKWLFVENKDITTVLKNYSNRL